jgi:putative FmdB family regulatory protein
MAIRCYSCPRCGEIEESQRISDPVFEQCPRCGNNVRSILSLGAPPVFVYKPHQDCSGWSGEGYSKAEHKRKADKILGRS